MNGRQYLKNQLSVILINLLGMLALALFLIASGNPVQTALFILAVWMKEYKEYIEQWIHEVKTPITAMKLICENNRCSFTRDLMAELGKYQSLYGAGFDLRFRVSMSRWEQPFSW